MKSKIVSTELSQGEIDVLAEVSKLTNQTPAQFIRTAINHAFEQFVEDGKLVSPDEFLVKFFRTCGPRFEACGGSMVVGDRIEARERAKLGYA